VLIAVAVSCASAALVPWGSEVAAQGAVLRPPLAGTLPNVSGPALRSLPATGSDPLASLASEAYRALAVSTNPRVAVISSGYPELRRELAFGVANRIGADPMDLLERWSLASVDRQLALLAGLSQLGVPYRKNASRPGVGFDCSGLTSFAWAMVGEQLPRNSRAQIRSGERVKPADVQPGDLAYYPGHVMMSLGLPGAVLHSPEPGRRVHVRMVTEQKSRRWVYADPIS
jgi:hypothetical protein